MKQAGILDFSSRIDPTQIEACENGCRCQTVEAMTVIKYAKFHASW
jgi:hypothetical protein